MSHEEILNTGKCQYEDALKKSGFKVDFKYTKNQRQKPKNRSRNIIWFNPPFNKAVSTNIAKIFLRLINRHFPKSHRLHKIFNRNTVKVSYSCMQNMSKIYKGHNSKITSTPCNQLTLYNSRVKEECPMDIKRQTMNADHDCRITSSEPREIHFALAEGKWKKRYYNHEKSFNHKRYWHETTLSSYVQYLKERLDVTPNLKWSVVACATTYSNISKKWLMCLSEKLVIIT